ncbi:ECF transporter S component [Bacillus kexueae]|uniref:ECF transporter S component n=1 Tax=Aeribacillus kexueae TaxID=2078952 RepID=UPI001FB010F6|nr:ECF transporter S component [Bacillus kexueae]
MRNFTVIVMFISLSVIGAMIKIPAIVGSVALDSFPAFLAAILLHPVVGGIVAFAGHFLSSLLVGFPLGGFHLLIAAEMFALVYLFGILFRKSKWGALFTAILLNGLVLPLPFYAIMGGAFYVAIVPSLLIAAVVNVGVALLLAPRLAAFLTKRGLGS